MIIKGKELLHGLTVVAVWGAIALGGCSSSSRVEESANEAEDAVALAAQEVQVVTTFLPITQFTKAVAGDRAEVIQLLPTNVGPHDYQAKPADVQAIAKADVLVKNGLEMEVFLDDLIDNAGNSDLVEIDSSKGVATISNEGHDEDHHDEGHHDENHHDEDHHDEDHHDEGHHDEGHHDEDHHDEGHHDDHHDEGHHDEDHHDEDHHDEGHHDEGHHHHGEFNPHIWLDPKRAIQQVENIRDGLIAVDPEGRAEYTANAAAYINSLQALDAEIAKRLAPYQGKTFVGYHDFAPYFADSYNIEAEFLVDVPEENPSPEDVRRVIEVVKATNLKTLLTEPQVGANILAAIAGDLNIKVSTFDPLETGVSNATEPQYYLNIMRQNAENLEEAFGGSVQSGLLEKQNLPLLVSKIQNPFIQNPKSIIPTQFATYKH
ncbi:MAG: zinc ABC transporter solute-binding protein [Oscillatoria sp. SIO1A7]|nr:zinc ABC transporter solute-binding protein [Oscillatoria sp. SIO1A7]